MVINIANGRLGTYEEILEEVFAACQFNGSIGQPIAKEYDAGLPKQT